MYEINKYKQNSNNAPGADRRKRRTKLNFRTRAGHRALTISNVPSDILDAINELAARQDRGRSSFVRRELQRIVAEYRAKEGLSKSQ